MERSKENTYSNLNGKDPKEAITNLLETSFFAYLCTVNGNMPHVTPVFFVYVEDSNSIYFMSSLKSKKMKNLLTNNRVSLTIDVRDPVNPFKNKGIMIEGIAQLVAELYLWKPSSDRVFLKDSAKQVLEMFEKKYPILKQPELNNEKTLELIRKFAEVLVSIKLKKIIYWGGGPKFTRVKY